MRNTSSLGMMLLVFAEALLICVKADVLLQIVLHCLQGTQGGKPIAIHDLCPGQRFHSCGFLTRDPL